jgi:RimJ/RimL family protein N-acetyltransferase
LYTDRLILRDFEETDWLAVHEYGSDPEVVRYMLFAPNTEADTRDYISRKLTQQKEEPRRSYDLALITRREGRLIGACGIYVHSPQNREGWIGYILNRGFWGQGYMTEAAQRIVGFGFEELGLHRIYATCDPANVRSTKVMEKLRMRWEGHLREHQFAKGTWRDSLLYAVLENEWRDASQH